MAPPSSRQAQELRVKETDRIAAIAHNLRVDGRTGDRVERRPRDSWPGRRLRGGRVASFGDHRIVMAFAIAGTFRRRRNHHPGRRVRGNFLSRFQKRARRIHDRKTRPGKHTGDRIALARAG